MVEAKFAAPVGMPAAEKIVEAVMVQVDSDPFSQAEMTLNAPYAEVLMTALAVWKFLKSLKKIALA